MATAAELLAGELIVDDAWFEVDLLARRINIPKSITNLGAKSESDVTHVKFKLPRFLNDIDFADFEIGIDYTNAQGEEDRYEPKDVTVNEDIITFTWVVGRHAALYQGNVTFGLCAKRPNPDDPDNPLNEFHTTKASLPILDAMETCEEAVIEHTDLLEQWRRDLFGAGYVKDTDYATATKAGVVRIDNGTGIAMRSDGVIYLPSVNTDDIFDRKAVSYPLKVENIDDVVINGIAYNELELTETEKQAAKKWLGITEGGGNGDLTDYVKNTDYATADKAGVVKVGTGFSVTSDGKFQIEYASQSSIASKMGYRNPLVPQFIDDIVKAGITTNQIPLTAEEKQAAKDWLGITEGGGNGGAQVQIITWEADD